MDRRDRVRREGRWYEDFDRTRMVVTVKLYMTEEEQEPTKFAALKPKEEDFDDDRGDYGSYLEAWNHLQVIKELPVKMQVCGTCDGSGKHVNPSIDAHGISQDEFYADPDFKEAYFGGLYDVVCYECDGRNVAPNINEELVKLPKYRETYVRYLEDQEERRQARAEDMAEARYFGYC